MFRALFMTFEGEFKGGSEADHEAQAHGPVHLAESPAVMVIPLVVLGIPAIVAGFLANSTIDIGIVPVHWLTHFLDQNPAVHVAVEAFNVPLAIISNALALAGIITAYAMYKAKVISPAAVGTAFKPLYTLFYRKYYLDELYEDIIVRRVLLGSVAYALDWFDRSIVDKLANFSGWLGVNTGTALRQVQTGQLQSYGMAISLGILVIFGIFLFIR